MRIDLHTHSSASDGRGVPAQVMREAARAGLAVVALTDHDTTIGWAEASQAAREVGVTLVPGAEISCSHWGISVHLLSYLQDQDDPALQAETERARESREVRAERMAERIAQDYALDWADVLATVAPGATIGRPHLADALVARGHVTSRDEAFTTILANGSPYYVPHYAPDPVHAVRLVVAAGGVPVFAHPLAARGRVVGVEVIEAMVQAGLAGLEVDHRDHDEPARARLRAIADRLGLLVTGSSDYHGDGKPNRLGENTTTPEVYEEIVRRGTGTAVVRP